MWWLGFTFFSNCVGRTRQKKMLIDSKKMKYGRCSRSGGRRRATQPVGIGVVDNDVRHLPRVFQGLGLAPVRADLAHNRFRQGIEIDGSEG